MDFLPKKFIDISTVTKVESISKGAQGEVSKVTSPDSDSMFALKVYLSEKHILGLQDEITALSNLEHPNIVQMRGFNQNSILLDLHQKDTLFDLASKKRFSERVAKFYLLELMNALKYMHDKNWVHRDIKLENILISQDFHLVLADFGFAKEEDPMKPFTDHKGTRGYSAPEILRKESFSGKKGDIFAAGVTLFGMVVRRMPFQAAIQEDIFYKELSNNPAKYWRAFKNQGYQFSIQFMDLVTRMLTLDPNNRINVDEILQHPWLRNNQNPCTQAEVAQYFMN